MAKSFSKILMLCCAIWISLVLWVFSLSATANEGRVAHLAQRSFEVGKEFEVIKSPNDDRSYRYLVLDNQLRVLLISDAKIEKSAAALSVHVGSNQNPSERHGLAHFLEHMLFLGNEKYPKAGEYQAFISRHGGVYNAYTAAEHTNYFFDIESSQFEPALDRFAQFFIAPLLSVDYVERERNAVHSEFVAKLQDDARREWDIYRELMNPIHPSAKFSVGNHLTLADTDHSSIRDELVAFYQRYYSAHLMTLVVLGHENLNDLETLVTARFNQIPVRAVEIPKNYPAIFTEYFLPARVEIKPEKDIRQLTFNFPIPNPEYSYTKKPYGYIAHLLAHEGEGSLLGLLKRLGWAESLDAGVGLTSRSDALFQIQVQLTSEGVKAKDQIASLIFYMLDKIQSHGLQEWRYDELKHSAATDFLYKEKQSPLATVKELAPGMHIYSPADALRGSSMYDKYDEDLLQKSLSYLTPENLLWVLVAPDVDVYRISKFYEAPYSVRTETSLIADLKAGVKQELSLPGKNVFISSRLLVKSKSMLEEQGEVISSAPEIILANKNIRVWFQQDRQFAQPRAVINLRLTSPLVAASAQGAAQAQIFAALINDQLSKYTYPASLAGLNSRLQAHQRGFDIQVAGYSNKQNLLLNKITAALRTARFDEDRFNSIKQDVLRLWKNEAKTLPFQVLAKQVQVLHYAPSWSNEELIAALEKQTFEQFNRFAARVLIDATLDGLFYGNYFKSEALKLSVLLEYELLGRQTGRDTPPAQLLMLPKNLSKPWLYQMDISQSDHIAELLIQSPSTSTNDAAHMQLIRQILQPAFFNELRTEKQLGYIVAALPMPIYSLESSLFVVQSPFTNEAKLIDEIDQFLKYQAAYLDDNFIQNQQSLIKQLQEPPRSLTEQAERYWGAIHLGDYSFARRAELAAAVGNITQKSLNTFYQKHFLQKNQRLWLSSSRLTDVEKFRVIDKIADYKNQLEIIHLP